MNHNQNYRKKTGEFYTPSPVVDFMIERVFSQLISSKRVNLDNYPQFTETLSKLRFCDPSIGNGNFILGLLKWLWNVLKSYTNVDGKLRTDFFYRFVTSNIFGVELNSKSLEICKVRISKTYSIFQGESFDNLKCGNSIIDVDAKDMFSSAQLSKMNPFSWEESFSEFDTFDVIIGNPPYFNLKKIETRTEGTQLLFSYLKNSNHWKHLFRASSDIYYFFIMKSLSLLKNDGIVSLITPNYWIENQYADLLRSEILRYQILEIIDLEGIKIFKDEGRWLNVSTCILTVHKKSANQIFKFVKKLPKNFFELKKSNRKLPKHLSIDPSKLSTTKWIMSRYLSTIEEISNNNEFDKLGDIAKIAQGLSPGVKDVFVLDQHELKINKIEEDVLVPFVTNRHIQRWLISKKKDLKAILPSRIVELSEYPNTQIYLTKNKQLLTMGPDRKRLMKENKIRWFDYSVYRNLSTFNESQTKIICPYRSLIPRFSLDKEKHFGATDTYAIVPRDEKDTLAILGILNCSFTNFWFREAGKTKGKMLEFFSFPLKGIPIPSKGDRAKITKYVKQILSVLNQVDEKDEKQISIIEEELDSEIAQIYGLKHDFLMKYSINK
ncbi:MAG: Eco57I restriction-modification methylase domain-containing protein [Candidatus Heimdallarchaeaceae archaeon]